MSSQNRDRRIDDLRRQIESLIEERDSLMDMLEDYDLVELWRLKYRIGERQCNTSA